MSCSFRHSQPASFWVISFLSEQSVVLTLLRSCQAFQAQVTHQSFKYRQYKSNNTLTFQHSIGTKTQTAVIKSSYIRQFYIYGPQALENLEDNLESKVKKILFQNRISQGDSRSPKENYHRDPLLRQPHKQIQSRFRAKIYILLCQMINLYKSYLVQLRSKSNNLGLDL